MLQSKLFFIFGLLLLTGSLFSQSKPQHPPLTANAPLWQQLLAGENPNVFDVQKAYADFYRDHAFEKNSWTQFFKRWMHWARPLTQPDGFVKIPSPEEQDAFEKSILQQRAQSRPGTGTAQRAGSWTFAGPKKHLRSDDGVTPISEHTNIYSFDIAPSNASVLYAGGESGGLWKTTDKGLNWTLLTKNIAHGAFGAVKIHPTNTNIVWAATGGKIIKTTDGGSSWTTVFAQNGLWVNEFAISTADPNIIMAAADQGLFRSTNGGTTWTALFTNQTWAVKMKPADATTFFAIRKNGSSSNFMRSTDSGATFSAVGTGWWAPGAGETMTGGHIAVCPSNPSKLYAYIIAEGGNLEGYVGVFKSTDNGNNWSNTHPTNAIGTPYSIPNHVNIMDASGTVWFNQGFYDMAIAVNPANDQELVAGGCSWWKSTNGGQTWTALGGYVGNFPDYRHPDIQQMMWVGSDLWFASDGGLDYSNNGGATIASRNNGISGADLWGFDAGWNDDILVGGRYHNGNMGYFQSYPAGSFLSLGGGEAATGYVNPGPGRKTYFSDIGGKRLPATITGGVQYFSVSDFPNESYAYYANSEMVWHPDSWGIVFMGKDNKLWKSTDGGSTFSAVYTFPGNADNDVFDIEISRSNPQIMYCSQWDGTDDKIWRSSNGGQNWTACTALPLPNNNDRVKLALDGNNPDVLWAAVTYGSNGKKVYKTINGGNSWSNLTTATLNNLTVSNIMAQYGTNGGVYIGTNGGVFYRNNTHTDWQAFSDGLPVSAETNRLKPFYRDGKIRNGCWGFGVWESPLFEPSTPTAKAMADKLYSGCARDTFFFDDHSAVMHTGAAWLWQFPGAAWSTGNTTRTPKATYAAPGTYNAIMALTYAGTTTYDTISLTVGSECAPDSLPGKAVFFGGNANAGSVIIPPLNVNTNTFSVTAWIRPDVIQTDYASVFMFDGPAAGLHFQPDNNHLGYHWPNGAWWWDSGLEVPVGQWSHVALVVTPTAVTIYLNGVPSSHTGLALPKVNFNTTSRLGSYQGWGDRYMRGRMDEVCIYNKALTQNDIRLKMNLRKVPSAETQLLAYYQFNEVSGGTVYDRAKTKHASLSGSASRVNSTVAIGPGTSYRRTISVGGTHSFGVTNITSYFPTTGTFPSGEVVATRINLAPDQTPNADPVSRAYWVVRNYGTNQNFTQLTKILFSKIGNVPSTTTPSQYSLFRRPVNAEGNTWAFLDAGDLRTAGTDGAVTFSTNNNVTTFGQFIITKPVAATDPSTPTDEAFAEREDLRKTPEVLVSPNPVALEGTLRIETDLSGEASFRLLDAKGRAVRVVTFIGATQVELHGLAAGVYFYSIENESFMTRGKVVVR